MPVPLRQPRPRPAQPARRPGALRTIAALMLRETATSYGRSALGYVWAVLEPVAGILLMSAVFAAAFSAPALGTSFPLFFASGILPFMAYQDISQKISVSLRFSRQLLFYPGVTFLDALLARFILNAGVQVVVAGLVLAAIVLVYRVEVVMNPPDILMGLGLAAALALGVGTLNCYLLSAYPVWERAWAILNRPLFVLSCVFFLFDAVPRPYRDWLWWNPLVHVVGQLRKGLYPTYEAAYVTPGYVLAVAMLCFAPGLLMLRRHHRAALHA